ncbi:MAG: mycothiol system anti-sigma-R factor [Actinomycetia bacterium]|nr:mycothiol system anti-sigma-R factor [Actinomycetes bacterium]
MIENSRPAGEVPDEGTQDRLAQEVSPAPAHVHETDCSEFRLRIYEYMDGELGAEEHLRFEAHVRHCTVCLQQHRVDETIKGLIRRVEHVVVAPDQLRATIRARITQIRLQGP